MKKTYQRLKTQMRLEPPCHCRCGSWVVSWWWWWWWWPYVQASNKKMIVEQEKRKKKEPHTWGSRHYVSNPIHPGVGSVLVVIRRCRRDFHTLV